MQRGKIKALSFNECDKVTIKTKNLPDYYVIRIIIIPDLGIYPMSNDRMTQ